LGFGLRQEQAWWEGDAMKWMVLSLVGLGLTAAVGKSAELIPWFTDFRQACELAAEQRRLVLLHFYNDNCEPCRRLEQNVFSQPQVAQALAQSYVPVKVHAGRNPALATRYQVQRWPTDVIVTPSGLEVFRTISPQKPAEYIALMQQVAQQAGVHTRPTAPAPTSRPSPPEEAPPVSVATPPAWQTTVTQAAATRRSAFLVPEESPAQGLTPAVPPASAGPPATSGAATSSQPPPTATPSQPAGNPPAAAPASATASASTWNPPSSAPAAAGQHRPAISPWPSSTPAQMARRVENPWVPRASQTRDSVATAAGLSHPSVSTAPASAYPPPAFSQPPTMAYGRPPAQPNAPAAAAGARPGLPHSSPPNLVPASQAPPVALDGFCPVTLVEVVAQDPTDRRAWKKGDPRFGAIHDGRTYLFASAEQQQKFLAHPEAYAPILGGYDPVHLVERGVWVEGKRAYGLITPDQKIYLFADEDSLARFHQFPERYTGAAVQQASAALRGPNFYR
jgi:YHS domain-containing protein/thiol-disulfide isomerase/thioredoxin